MRFVVKACVVIAGFVILLASAVGLLLAIGGVEASNKFGVPVAASTSRARLEELVEEGAAL